MQKSVKRFLLKIAICMAMLVIVPTYANAAQSNVGGGDIGNYGVWATENNHNLFKKNLTDDIDSFQSQFQNKVLVADYVPIEARVGRSFIGAMSMVSQILDRSLVRFVKIFLIILLTFWVMLESYQMMKGDQNANKLGQDIVKKLIIISLWIFILEIGPARLFMWIMGPVITIGTYLSDLILNSISTASGAALPDTCAAIHKYMTANPSGVSIIDANQTANLLCVPTRLSGFFYTAVSAGFHWMLAGIGTSAFTFAAGATFVVIFIYNIWKFALMALSVIADLFFGLIMLPFTAITECFGTTKSSNADAGMFGIAGDLIEEKTVGKGTSYDGYAGQIFNKFLELFKAESLSKQVQRFINATIYFVSLSIVIAICAALLSGVIDVNLASTVPSLENDGFMTVLIVGALVAYLATKASDIAKKLGGSIDESFGNRVGGDIKKVWGNATNKTKEIWKIIRKTK